MIITPTDLQGTVVNANLDDLYLQNAINEAEDVYLREILGDLLYNTIINKINNQTLNGKYLTLVDNYVKIYLQYKVQALLVPQVAFKIRNSGILSQYDQGFNTTSVKDTMYVQEQYDSKSEFYANRLTTYLQKNAADFPEYGYSDDNITQPTETQNVTTIYLGGGRKKGCGCNTTQQATTTTVDWDNITNKPDFADVAFSNDYEDLDNKPTIPVVPTNVSSFTNDAGYLTQHQSLDGYATESWVQEQGFSTFSGSYEDLTDKPSIPTVNDALLTIKQGGVTKGTFSANANENVEIDLEAGGSGSTDWDDIQNKPNFANVAITGDYDDLENKPDLSHYVEDTDLAQVATSGDYRDLINTPSLGAVATSNDYDDLDNKPTIVTPVNADWNETDPSELSYIKGKPSLAQVATSGDYRDLSNTPSLGAVATSNDYRDLTNKPTIPAAQVQTDWNANSGMGEILNKPSMATETWTFTVDDGQGGTTAVTKTVWLQPTV